jgi:hypothetical protein
VLAGAGKVAGKAAGVLRSPWKLVPVVGFGLLRGGQGLGGGLLWAGAAVEVPAEFAMDAERLTVRVLVHFAPDGEWAEYQFLASGHRVRAEWPLAATGSSQALGSLRVVVRQAHPQANLEYELAGPSDAAGRYRIGPVTEELLDSPLARRSFTTTGEAFAVIERDTGNRLYYEFPAPRLPDIWDVRLDEETGIRVIGGPRKQPTVVGAQGSELSSWRAWPVGDSRVAVVRNLSDGAGPVLDSPVLLVHTDSLRIEVPAPEQVAVDADGVRVRLPVPGAPQETSTEYRFGRDAMLLGEDIPPVRGLRQASSGSRRNAVPMPLRVIRDMPFPERELRLRMRVVETGEGPQAARRLELLDFDDPARQVWWFVDERDDGDGGFRIVDERGDRRWYLTPDGELEFREVRLTRTNRFVRFPADGRDASIVEFNGNPAQGEYALEPVVDGRTGQETGLTVRLAEGAGPQPGAPVAWRVDSEGLLKVSEMRP